MVKEKTLADMKNYIRSHIDVAAYQRATAKLGHLFVHAKKRRTRKKNARRIRKEFLRLWRQ